MTDLNTILGVCVICYDPDPLGGFPNGARMQGLGAMLKMNSFTPGTVLVSGGRRWRVHVGPDGRQKLVLAERREQANG